MIDQDRLTIASRTLLEKKLRVLQGYRFAPSDEGHISRLLDYMDPRVNTTWVDIGCGFGEPARLMREFRPDLYFWLVNNNEFQLSHTPRDMPVSNSDMHDMPFEDNSFDGAMFLFSLCQADNAISALREAARVVKPRGDLFVFDYVRTRGDDRLSRYHLDAQFLWGVGLPAVARISGWELDEVITPPGDDSLFREVFEDQDLYDRIFRDLIPVIWRGIKL